MKSLAFVVLPAKTFGDWFASPRSRRHSSRFAAFHSSNQTCSERVGRLATSTADAGIICAAFGSLQHLSRTILVREVTEISDFKIHCMSLNRVLNQWIDSDQSRDSYVLSDFGIQIRKNDFFLLEPTCCFKDHDCAWLVEVELDPGLANRMRSMLRIPCGVAPSLIDCF